VKFTVRERQKSHNSHYKRPIGVIFTLAGSLDCTQSTGKKSALWDLIQGRTSPRNTRKQQKREIYCPRTAKTP